MALFGNHELSTTIHYPVFPFQYILMAPQLICCALLTVLNQTEPCRINISFLTYPGTTPLFINVL